MKTYKLIAVLFFSTLVGAAAVLALVKYKPVIFFPKKSADSYLEEESEKKLAEDFFKSEDELFDDLEGLEDKFIGNLDSFFNDEFFKKDQPFESMKNFRKKIEKRLKKSKDFGFEKPFDSWFETRFGGGSAYDITKREDQENVYYDIKVSDVKSTSVKTKVEDGHIIITGKTSKKTKETKNDARAEQETYFEQSFTRSFPLFEDIDQNKMEMTVNEEANVVTLKFPKIL